MRTLKQIESDHKALIQRVRDRQNQRRIDDLVKSTSALLHKWKMQAIMRPMQDYMGKKNREWEKLGWRYDCEKAEWVDLKTGQRYFDDRVLKPISERKVNPWNQYKGWALRKMRESK